MSGIGGFVPDPLGVTEAYREALRHIRMTSVETPPPPLLLASDDKFHDEATCPACAVIQQLRDMGKLSPNLQVVHEAPVPTGGDDPSEFSVQVSPADALLTSYPRTDGPLQPGDPVTFYPVKLGAMVPITHEQFGRPLTDEQRAQIEAKRVERKAETAAWLEQLRQITDPLARAILDLHRAERSSEWADPRCAGCDFDGYEAEEPLWPCRTVELVAERFGCPAPEWVELKPGVLRGCIAPC